MIRSSNGWHELYKRRACRRVPNSGDANMLGVILPSTCDYSRPIGDFLRETADSGQVSDIAGA